MPTKRASNKEQDDMTVIPQDPNETPIDTPTPATPVTPYLPPQVILESSVALRKITMIIRNGAISMHPSNGTPPFTPHPGMMILLIHAYRAGDVEAFVTTVERYLEQAVRHVPHTGTKEEIPDKITALRKLIDQVGLRMVGQRMLANIYAPI